MIRRQQEIEDFLAATKFSGAKLLPLAGDASMRRYVRVVAGDNIAMVMDTPAEGENFPAFITIAEYLYNNGYSAPQILARDIQQGFLLLEDFGDESFTKILKTKQTWSEKTLYSTAIDLLAELVNLPQNSLSLPPYNDELYLREISLFADWFMPQFLGMKKATDLRYEYMEIWQKILCSFPLKQNVFVHRDFHADNLMWLPERNNTKRVGLLDFQDAVIGNAAYDVVSLLEDARRDVPHELIVEMTEHYTDITGADKQDFDTAYNILGAQRNSKIVGIFVRLAVRDRKENYMNYLPRVWKHLERDIKHPLLVDLRKWLDKHITPEMRGK